MLSVFAQFLLHEEGTYFSMLNLTFPNIALLIFFILSFLCHLTSIDRDLFPVGLVCVSTKSNSRQKLDSEPVLLYLRIDIIVNKLRLQVLRDRCHQILCNSCITTFSEKMTYIYLNIYDQTAKRQCAFFLPCNPCLNSI